MTAPEPIATGTLAQTPLAHLLVYLDQKRLSGTLAVWLDELPGAEPKKHDRILLLKGCPVAGRLIEPVATLREGLLKLFSRSRAPYAFYETNLLGDDRISGRVDPMSLITESLRSTAHEEVVDQVLERFGGARLRLVPGTDLKRYEFAADERALIELLQAEPADIESLVEGCGLHSPRARRVLYLLAISKAVMPFDAGAPAQAPRSKPSAPAEQAAAAEPPAGAGAAPPEPAQEESEAIDVDVPPADFAAGGIADDDGPLHGRLDRLQSIPPPPEALADEVKQRWLRVVAKGRLIENQNYFEMLDLDKDAKSSDARAKFYQMAKEWHPDRLPAEMQSLRDYVQIIFSYLSEASAALGDEQQRIKYVQTVREGGGTPATERLMQTILDTAMEYERALVMSRKHEFDEALEVMRKILSVVKDEPDYHAMNAWLMMQKFPGQEAPLPKMLESVNRALELFERHERANMLKAQILRRMGKQSEALKYFRLVADINPRNIEAVREVRVHTMRTSTPPDAQRKGKKGKDKGKEESGVGGLLGKLFKRD